MEKNKKTKSGDFLGVRWLLVAYDTLAFALIALAFYFVFKTYAPQEVGIYVWQSALLLGIVLFFRFVFNVYGQIWRYGGIRSYILLLFSDACSLVVATVIFLVITDRSIFLFRLSMVSLNLLLTLAMRMVYRYIYKYVDPHDKTGKLIYKFVDFFAGRRIEHSGNYYTADQRIKIAIVGAGRVGVALAEELLNNSHSAYKPAVFIDYNREITGRNIYGIPVIDDKRATAEELKEFGIQEIVFALPKMDNEKRKQIYDYYAATGCKIKVYDYPVIQQTGSGRRALREFDVEELLFRKPVDMIGEKTVNYYSGKVVMITGGGGSIGSELARQIAKMQPKRLVLLDVYENGVYDVQQELRLTYGNDLDLAVEIVSVTNENGMRKIFERHRPQIVLHAAAHKHVPLMENNCVEAVENNVFGTLTTVDLSIEYGVEHFIMISTDKAVNPTNVMGATKRMCEMIVMSRSTLNKTSFSATRFGNVLGSAGSVIPLFKRQIAKGGPVTVTDKRIIRYFMTIPEASQLVLTSGQMSKNGELFVLDMGKPVRILDLAENIIRLAGFRPYFDIDILETGLRPGEKLYEELLVKTDELKKTDNDLIFIEEDNPVTKEELDEKLSVLRSAVSSGDDATVRKALRKVVPTYRSPEEVNKTAQKMIDEQTKQ